MRHQDDPPPITHTEADETSQTRFGPRPVPEGHRRLSGQMESRRIPPHGDVSPDGSHPWPHPSRGAKWLVWGGTGLVAAALTAGTVIAARHLIDLVSEKDGDPRRPAAPRDRLPPRYAASGRDMREPPAPRRPERIRAEAQPGRPARRAPRQGLLQEVEANTASLTHGVENVMQALTAALTGFRTVAEQAGTIMREFGDAATLVREIIDRKPAASQPRSTPRARRDAHREDRADDRRDAHREDRADDRHGTHMPDLRDDPLLHDPMEGPDPGGPADHDPRLHRL